MDETTMGCMVAYRRFHGAASVAVVCAFGSLLFADFTPSVDEAAQRGLIYQMPDYPQPNGHIGYGCGFADLDGDGDQDVILLGGLAGHVGVFENDGNGHFIDRSEGSGIPLPLEPCGFAVADYDGDADADIYITEFGEPNILVRNDGGFVFTDVTAEAGVGDAGAAGSPAWGDFDNDGYLDLYVANYNGGVLGTEALDNVLYRNNGDGTFTDVSVAQGVDSGGLGFQPVFTDYDRDGDVDLYLTNDRGMLGPQITNQLWRNDAGQYTDVSEESGADAVGFLMGLACGDFDRNGYTDLYSTDIDWYPLPGGDDGNPLLLNQGDGTFVPGQVEAGVAAYTTSWSAIFYDFDNNAHLDLYVNNQFLPNLLFHNPGTFPCSEVAAAMNLQGTFNVSFASAVADVDDDGAMDLLVNNFGSNIQLYINYEGQERNFIRFRVIGEGPNTEAVGGSVETFAGGGAQFHEIYAGGHGYLGQNELTVHVGLDDAIVADKVVVRWPSDGPTRTLYSMPAGETWSIYPPSHLGDADGDGQVLLDDFAVIATHYGQPIVPGCEMMDFDGDADIDLPDFQAFLEVYDGEITDCNDDGVPDLQELVTGAAEDANGDGVPDSCGGADVVGDLDTSGDVDVADLLMLLSAWGGCALPCPPVCVEDLDRSCSIDVADLLILLGNWG